MILNIKNPNFETDFQNSTFDQKMDKIGSSPFMEKNSSQVSQKNCLKNS